MPKNVIHVASVHQFDAEKRLTWLTAPGGVSSMANELEGKSGAGLGAEHLGHMLA